MCEELGLRSVYVDGQSEESWFFVIRAHQDPYIAVATEEVA